MDVKQKLIKAFTDFIDTYSSTIETSPVYKSTKIDEELQEATWVVLAPEEYDLHNDIYSAEEIAKACKDYEDNCMKANLHHLFMAGEDDVVIKESKILEEDTEFGDVLVKKGTWIQTWKINNKDIWKGVKEGFYNGLSIQCMASVEVLEE